MLDIGRIRGDFPITRQRFEITGHDQPRPLIYMDHGASTHPPTPVLDTYKDFLEKSYANVRFVECDFHPNCNEIRFVGCEFVDCDGVFGLKNKS